MRNRLRYILLTLLLIVATQAAGQYIIDRVCVGTVRYYRVDGEPGSTYTWQLTDPLNNVITLPSTADTVAITWSFPLGTYKLSAIQHSIANCDGLMEIGDIIVLPAPLADAGNPFIHCGPDPFQITTSSASNYTHLSWTTSGTGTFDNDTILHPFYTPTQADRIAGQVTLYLTASGLATGNACTPAIDSVIISLPLLTVSAGPDDTTCQGVAYQFINATGTNFSSVLWRHDGTGTIPDPTLLNPMYIPGVNETGIVNFTLTGYEVIPCTDSCADHMELYIIPAPTAHLSMFGADTLCGGDSTSFRVDLTGTPPWSLTLSDGITSINYTGITSSPFYAGLIPPQTGTWAITACSDANCNALPSGLSGFVHVIVYPRPGAEFTWVNGPQNNQIQFYIDSVIVNWQAVGNMVLWNFGDGTFGYEYNPLHQYPVGASYTYDVTLTVTDTNGCVSSITHQVYVAEVPNAFYSSTSPTCLGSPTCFTDLSTVPAPPFGWIEQWKWNFGDGSPEVIINFPNDPNVCHVYSALGTYPATLTITTNNGYTDTYTHNQEVIPNPVADFTFTSGCESQPVQFTSTSSTNNSVGIASYNWNFGDPLSGTQNTSTLQNPQHTFSGSATTYNVTLIIINLNNCSDTITKPVYVRPAPPVEFVHDSACIAGAVNFNANTGVTQIDSIATWAWDFGDGSPVSNSPVTATHTYSLTGTYVTTLTVTDIHGCINSVAHEVNVHPLPVPQFSWSTPACSGSALLFDDASYIPAGFTGYVAKWEWNFGDGSPVVTITLPASPNVWHTFPVSNNSYIVSLKVWSNDSCTQEISKVVNLIPGPTADFTVSPVTCVMQPVQFNDNSLTNGGGNITSWQWNFDDPASGTSNTSTIANPLHTYNTAGSYDVRLIVSNATGCIDTVIKTVVIGISPVASFTADTACFGSPTTFTNSSIANAAAIISYSWNFGDGGTSTAQNPLHTYSAYGTFTVTLVVTNSNGCTASTSQQVVVNPLPVVEFIYSSPNCLGAPVQFTSTSTTVPGYPGTIASWTWDFGDGNTVTVTAPASPVITHTFSGTALSHLVRLTVFTSDGCSAFAEHIVLSIPAPVAQFTSSNNTCENQPVAFTDISQPNGGGNISNWSWNFGDPASGTANFSAAQNPTHTFATAGTYQVTLIVANEAGCTDTVVNTVTIVPKPVANFTADTACVNNPTTFTDLSTSTGTILQWAWNFGDGGTSNLQNPAHTYQSAGVYTATLTVFTSGGCSSTITKQVLVLPKPIAMFTSSTQTCAGDTVYFTDMSTTTQGTITSWTWDFGDGVTLQITPPASPNVFHVYTTGTTFSVKLTVTTSNSCSDEEIQIITIQQAPVANFTYTPNDCQNIPVQFTDISQTSGGTPVTQWSWNFDDPASGILNTSTLQNPIHAFTSPGTFDVVLTVINASGCTDSIVKTVTVGASPVADFTADTACAGNPTQFTDQSTTTAGTITTWLWNFGDPSSGTNNTSNLPNPAHTYANAGNYQVTLTVVSSGGCVSDTVMLVQVAGTPVAMFQYEGACAGAATEFTDLSVAPNSQIISWFWDFGDGIGTSTVQNPSYTYSIPGTYNVTLTVSNTGGCADSITIPVSSLPVPVAAFSHNSFFCPQGRVDFQDISTSTGGSITERLWIFEPGYTSSLPNPTYIFNVTDTTYLVTLIVTTSNGCRDTIVDSVYVKPGFEFAFNSDTVCYKTATHFTPQILTPGDSLFSLRWEFGDPDSGPENISYEYAPSHVFTHPGTFTVKLYAINSDNCADSVYQTVTIRTVPSTVFSFVAIPDNKVVTFIDNSAPGSGNIVTWEWNFGDGSPSVIISAPGPGNINHTYNITGTYNVTLTVTNSYGCSSSIMRTVNLSTGIISNFTSEDTLVCARTPVIFHDNSSPVNTITLWHWSFGDGTDTTYSSHSPVIIHTYPNRGSYLVQLTVSRIVDGTLFADTSSVLINVHPAPYTSFISDPGCAGKITLFTDTSDPDGADAMYWNWNFGDPASGMSNTSTAQNPGHRYDIPGTYDVTLITKNEYSCSDTMIRTTRAHAVPEAIFENSPACTGKPTHFTDVSVPGDTSIQYWHWNFGVPGTKKDTAMIQNPSYRYSNAGEYLVKMMIMDKNGCYDTVDSLVNVFTSPISAFNVNRNINGMPGKIQLHNQSIGALDYLWDFGNGITSDESDPIVTYSDDGSYLIMLIAYSGNECTDTTYYRYEHLFKGLYIPNAFVPTSMVASNARFFQPVGVNLKTFKIEVFDEWGHRVWHSEALDPMGRPAEKWDGRDPNGNLMPQGNYMWKANATFIDGTTWEGSDIGKGEYKTMGTVALIR